MELVDPSVSQMGGFPVEPGHLTFTASLRNLPGIQYFFFGTIIINHGSAGEAEDEEPS